jgi:hypothetical protein
MVHPMVNRFCNEPDDDKNPGRNQVNAVPASVVA